jgi:hypothetical protein
MLICLLATIAVAGHGRPQQSEQVLPGRWTEQQAGEWYQRQGWLRGCNFIPSTAVNQLEMWQAETFDTATIDRELGWAEAVGMNCMRVFLHHAAWKIDRDGFKKRIDQYLQIAGRHGIRTLFVFFDDCWNPDYATGRQPDPQPGVHNSGWQRDPGNFYYKGDTAVVTPLLEAYVKDILTTFKDDRRILLWDLYNEPGGSNPYGMNGDKSLPLLQRIFAWARAVNPSQPLSVGYWSKKLVNLNRFQLENSDIITYHSYDATEAHQELIDSLKRYGRPLICTEYMARTLNSTFQSIMPLLKKENAGAINWGLVAGKTNTIFSWRETSKNPSKEPEPPLWFHDIFRKDGTPYRQEEVDVIKKLTGAGNSEKVVLRQAGDDGAAAYRIPGLATTNKGTLIAVYDIRHRSAADLQGDIDVGVSRSTDGGRTWQPMQTAIDMCEWGGLPQTQNGVGDPCILVDSKTGDIYIFALWVHGMENAVAWTHSRAGMTPQETGQLVYVKSIDDGKTWSKPVNITGQVKNPSWRLLLQGPGRAITMQNGTLVVPIQYIDSTNMPYSSIMYSLDRGKTWKTRNAPQPNTTEAQVAELSDGTLMLNMRDNRGGSRAVFITRDLGKTWTEHPTSRKALVDPVCMASLIAVRKKDNVLKKDILLFSNPNDSRSRKNLTIKASLDDGTNWMPENQLLLDERKSWGYSCLTMIDRSTVGILYEGSEGRLMFQAIRLKDILKSIKHKYIPV